MRYVVAAVVVAAVLAAPATASAPTLSGLQRQVVALRAQVATLQTQMADVATVQKHDEQVARCATAVEADNLNLVWHALVQVNGLALPDFPRFDDQGTCAAVGITRNR